MFIFTDLFNRLNQRMQDVLFSFDSFSLVGYNLALFYIQS